MIYCVWYPSGGFGHFVNAILSLYGKNFVRPKNSNYRLGKNGHSHALELVAPKYLHEPDNYNFCFCQEKNYSVLIDNGIHNRSDRFMQFFDCAKIIKICYNNFSWPVVAQTSIVKALGCSLDNQLDCKEWGTASDWAMREKYFLYLRDHYFRSYWLPDTRCINLDIGDLIEYNKLITFFQTNNIVLDQFQDMHNNWWTLNKQYFQCVLAAQEIMNYVQQNKTVPLNHIVDLWTQAVVYYFIWLYYGIEVQHNDYSNWFTSTKDIVNMLDKVGVSVDSISKSHSS